MSFFRKLVDWTLNKRRAFFIGNVNAVESHKFITNLEHNSHGLSVDVYPDYETLLNKLNREKSFYQTGIISKNDKKCTTKVLCYYIKKINPDIKLVQYTEKTNKFEEVDKSFVF